jgi:hypothetical protein
LLIGLWGGSVLYNQPKIRFEKVMNRTEKLKRFESALDLFVQRVRKDPNVLAAVLVGSLTEETIWRKDVRWERCGRNPSRAATNLEHKRATGNPPIFRGFGM